VISRSLTLCANRRSGSGNSASFRFRLATDTLGVPCGSAHHGPRRNSTSSIVPCLAHASAVRPSGAKTRLEFRPTPKHGSWLNMAENELSGVTRQCVHGCRCATIKEWRGETATWQQSTNDKQRGVDWQFRRDAGRTKLQSLSLKSKTDAALISNFDFVTDASPPSGFAGVCCLPNQQFKLPPNRLAVLLSVGRGRESERRATRIENGG